MSLMRSAFFFIAVPLFFSACRIDKPIPPGGSDTTGSKGSTGSTGSDTIASHKYYVKGILNGTPFDWEVDSTKNRNWSANDGGAYGTQDGNSITELDGIIYDHRSTNSIPAIYIGFQTFEYSNNADSTVTAPYFNSFITTGKYPYASGSTITPGPKQIAVYYSDAYENTYGSNYGVQTGSSANVISVTQMPNPLGVRDSLYITVTFSCKMYDVHGSGSSVTITNGKASIYIPDKLY